MERRKFKWTAKQFDKLNKVIAILTEFEKYKPLTLRQIYYQLVGKNYIENNVTEYTMLSGLLKHARIDGYISWNDIEDRVRAFHNLVGSSNSNEFIENEMNNFLLGYARDLMQTQDKYIEIWIEKDALSTIFTEIARRYTIPVVVCRGFSSASFLNDLKNRIEQYSKNKRRTLMLYFGDFDPSGMAMMPAMQTTLSEEMKVSNIEFKRIGLSIDDIINYKLPYDAKALKKTDSRAKKHIETHGSIAVELDALRPDVLEGKIRDAINKELDINAFNNQVEMHNSDVNKLNILKTNVENFLMNQ